MSLTVKAWRNGQEVKVCYEIDPFDARVEGTTDFFTLIAVWEIDDGSAYRTTGHYALGSATAELERQSYQLQGVMRRYNQLSIKAGDLDSAWKLYELIRGGKILPTVSYEAVQHQTAIRQFADLWREFVLLVRLSAGNLLKKLSRC
jgi:hypothetical protein